MITDADILSWTNINKFKTKFKMFLFIVLTLFNKGIKFDIK